MSFHIPVNYEPSNHVIVLVSEYASIEAMLAGEAPVITHTLNEVE